MTSYRMPDINTVLIAGTVVEEPQLSRTDSGRTVGTFRISSIRRFRDNSGQWRENRCEVGVVVHQRLAELCQRYLRVGSPVLLDGELQSRSVEEGGTARTILEIRARRVQFLDRTGRTDLAAQAQPARSAEASEPAEPEEPAAPSEFDFGYRDLEL